MFNCEKWKFYIDTIYDNSANIFIDDMKSANYVYEKDVLPIEEILVRYRPYDKYVDKHMKDKKETAEFYSFLSELAKNPNMKTSDLSFVITSTPEAEQASEEQLEQEQNVKKSKKSKDKSDKKSKNAVGSNNEDDELTL